MSPTERRRRLAALAREAGRSVEQIVDGIVDLYLESHPKNPAPLERLLFEAWEAALLHGEEHGQIGTWRVGDWAEGFDYPEPSVRARLSTMRRRGELNYRKVRKGVFRFAPLAR